MLKVALIGLMLVNVACSGDGPKNGKTKGAEKDGVDFEGEEKTGAECGKGGGSGSGTGTGSNANGGNYQTSAQSGAIEFLKISW